ncbi:MAG: ribonuclease H-like domain-containing protein [Halodesulfurarchaeum sp.]
MRVENSFIPVHGVGETTERSLWREGITHWDAFTPEAVGPTTADRIEDYLATARPRLDDGDAQFFGETLPNRCHWRLYENFREAALFFDIETTGLSKHQHVVTTVSVHRDGETRTYVRDRDLTREALAAEFADAKLIGTFNGKQFDVPFLEHAFDLDIDLPHLDLRFLGDRVGFGGGLKRVERDLGIERDRPDISGRDAVRLWHEYDRGGDADALETLIAYNRDDARNLATLADELTGRLHDRVFPETD